MLHLQQSTNDWTTAIAGTFPYVIKAVDQGNLLRDAKAVNPNVFTVLRHHYDGHQVPGGSTVDENIQNARDFFATFIDETFRLQYAATTDAIESWNEAYGGTTPPDLYTRFMAFEEAAAQVWKQEYRVLPEYAHIRLVIGNVGVGNDLPFQLADIAIQYDCILGYHAYSHWQHGVRDPGDWQYHSGRWAEMDLRFNLPVDWLFTEAGPYEATETGWRSPECLGGDTAKYVEAVRQWLQDVKETEAFRTHRVIGFCLFTTGGGSQWQSFETRQPEMSALTAMIAEEWKMPTQYLEGIDVSRYQGTIDWARVAAAGAKFAAIRCTVGDYYTDPTWDANHAQARANGVLVTAYHVVKPSKSVTAQIARLRDAVGDRVLDIVPALDVELTDGLGKAQVTECILGCVAETKRLFGVTPLIYTGAWFWNPNVVPGTASECPLWISYYPQAVLPVIPTGTWQDWTIWQYSSNTRIDGITANTVDKNRAKSLPLMPVLEPEPEPEPCPGCAELTRQLADCQAQLAEVTVSRDAAWALLLQIRNLADGMV